MYRINSILIFFTIGFLFYSSGCKNNNQKPKSLITQKKYNHNYGSFMDIRDNHIYRTIKIGEQLWMADNLAFNCDFGCNDYPERDYRNNKNNARVMHPLSGGGVPEEYIVKENVGKLYTFNAAKKSCPPGWHLPSDDEWKQLELFLGLPQDELDSQHKRGIKIGKSLAEYGSSGFDAQLCGHGSSYGDYWYVGYSTIFWTSSLFKGSTRDYTISRRFDGKYIDYSLESDTSDYYSVRCLKD